MIVVDVIKMHFTNFNPDYISTIGIPTACNIKLIILAGEYESNKSSYILLL
jgi:hypothetical protein